jgi:hypothetical protein
MIITALLAIVRRDGPPSKGGRGPHSGAELMLTFIIVLLAIIYVMVALALTYAG